MSHKSSKNTSTKSNVRRLVVKIIACVLVLAITLLLALTIGNQDYRATAIGWMPFLTTLALIGICFAYVKVARNSLEYIESADLIKCERGQKLPFSIQFKNKGPLILLNLQVELFVADVQGGVSQTTTTLLTLGSHASIDTPFEIPFDHVGMFEAGLRSVKITDFIGLFEHTVTSNKTTLVCVTPRVPRLGSLEFSEDSERENLRTMKTALADSLDYAYVRDYEPGDPLKKIHWKLSARTDHYLTRLFEKSISPGVIVLLDFYSLGQNINESMDLRDAVIESALSIANYSRSRGLDTEIRYVNLHGERRSLDVWDDGVIVNMVKEMPRSLSDPALEQSTLKLVKEIATDVQAANNVIVCTANVDDEMVGTTIMAKQCRKSPFFVAAIPHRLVDRELEKYISGLRAFEPHRVGYEVITASSELEGRCM